MLYMDSLQKLDEKIKLMVQKYRKKEVIKRIEEMISTKVFQLNDIHHFAVYIHIQDDCVYVQQSDGTLFAYLPISDHSARLLEEIDLLIAARRNLS